MIKDFTAGESQHYEFEFVEEEEPCGTETIIDITGATVVMMFKEDLLEENAEADIEVTGIVTDGPAGKAEITLTADDTDVRAGRYFYDVRITDILGNVSYPLEGRVNIQQPVNRRT